jgi:Domain of unknown function (DUF4386)
MKQAKYNGYLLVAGALGVLIPYVILTVTFDYPGVLRYDTGEILRKFQEGGSPLIFTWLAFGLSGILLMIAYVQMGRQFENQYAYVRWVTNIGVISGVLQIIGLLRWVFVVPLLASKYSSTNDPVVRGSISLIFATTHQLVGVLIGEHLGQLFTVIWTIGMAKALKHSNYIPSWMEWLGYLTSGVYLLGQAELLATVIPGFPVWGLAGFLGSTLWLIWLMLVGMVFIMANENRNGRLAR